jgi:antitoxin YqcF
MAAAAPAASDDNKKLAKHAAAAFGGTPKVVNFIHDTDKKLSIPILSAADSPDKGITAYSTIGLSDSPMPGPDGQGEYPARLELCAAAATAADLFPNVISSAAFHIIKSKELFAPGDALSGYVAEYYPDTTVPHLYLTAPFLFDKLAKALKLPTKTVAWLLAVPITDEELEFLQENGDEALEDKLEEKEVDIFDLGRESAV